MEPADTGLTLINERLLHQWNENGRSDVLTLLTRALTDFTNHKEGSNLPRLLYELVWIVLHAKLPKHEVLGLLKETHLSKDPKVCDLLTDLLWVIGNEVENSERGYDRHASREWRNMCALVKSLVDEKLLSLLSLKATLEFDVLHEAELAPEPQVLAKKMVRINTKTLYTQTKYNLLREETEGFSKVLCLLHTGVTTSQLDATITDLMTLIGFFDLDANRVLDLVLDVYEMHPGNDCFAQLLGIFKRESLPHIIGFKFQFYKREPAATELTTPRSLYRLAATLLNKGLLELEALLPHLAPSRSEIVKNYVEYETNLIKKAGSVGQISLAAKKDSEKIENQEDVAKSTELLDREGNDNQVYGLIIGLFEIGAQERAFEMISWFQNRGVNPLTFKPLTTELCKVVNVMIEDVYAPLSSRSLGLVSTQCSDSTISTTTKALDTSTSSQSIRRVPTFHDCAAHVFPIVEMIGPHLFQDRLLFVKLLRIAGKFVEEVCKTSTTNADKDKDVAMTEKIKSLSINAFLPAMSLQECNPSTAFLVWDLVKTFPCDERYRMYLQWLEAYDNYPELRFKEAEVVKTTRGVMRRLTADRAQLSARSLTHVSHSNPLIVFRTMLRQIQSYDNLIQPVVESFKFVTPLGMDVLSFVLVSELSRPQKSMKSDGTHVSLWLTSLANFSGSFYRKYPNVELAGLLQYLIQRLQSWASVDLIVLSELLTKMGSCLSLEDISASQLEAQAGGPHLWYEPTDPKFQNRRAVPKLRDALIKRGLALPLCILICQMRSRIEYHEDNELSHLKLLGRVFDTCQLTLSQLLQFLGSVVDPLVYRKMLPSITKLVREYHVPPELAMTLCRPAMRSDDPVLQTVPRGVHATGGTNTATNGICTDGVALNDTSGEKHWYMYHPEFLEDIREALRVDKESERPFTGLTPEMYVTFWGLKLYDLHVPFQQYESEILRLRNSVTSGSNASLSANERKKLKEKTTQMIDVLTTEQKDQVAHRKRVFERLETMKSKFFKTEANDRHTAIDELLQKCVIPRALLSPEDALFTAKFIERLHMLSTPQLSSLQYFHKVNMKVSALVLCATEREASNFGIFMRETLGLILRWYQKGATYDEEAIHGKIGMSLDLTDDKKFLAHRQFKSAYARWHQQLEHVFLTALSGGKYMPIRNTLVVLTKLIQVYPAARGTADVILNLVEKLTDEDREDIKIMAKRYFALLTKRKASLVEDRLLRSRNFPLKAAAAVSSNNEKKNASTEEEKSSKMEDGQPCDEKREHSMTPASSRGESQEIESGEIVMGKSSNSSDGKMERSLDRGRRMERSRSNWPGRTESPASSQENVLKRSPSSDQRSTRREHRECDVSPARSSSTSNRLNESCERSGSAPRKHDKVSALRLSRSGERGKEYGRNPESRQASRERGRENEQVIRTGRNERGTTARLSRSRSHDRHERSGRTRESPVSTRDENDVTRRGDAPSSSPLSHVEPDKLTCSPPPDRSSETGRLNRGTRGEREARVEREAAALAELEAGKKRARLGEQSEAALRRQLTADKEAKAKEQLSIDRSRPIARDRMRPPLSSATASATGKASPPSGETPTGNARKIVSLVSSSRKRERETGPDSGDVSTASNQDDKRRRDGGGYIPTTNGIESRRGQDDKRKRRLKGGAHEGNNGNLPHPVRDQM
ncbi:hypothetical protein PsorP6_014730 [Peronosclerospora sorghi]|uniref:Uncharacterized protein n=1 Tax=Peronosclerospora sorghi TaxID=230839 RepID=A0ACC0VU13_9STRA|nr:hypothetical protein PsorP6_014730 [Peronosclerospora sorghi]